MGLLRSETMKFGWLILPQDKDEAKAYIEKIGLAETCHVQFEDMNVGNMHREFRKYIQRLDEMERIIRFMTNEVISKNPDPDHPIVQNQIDEYLRNAQTYHLEAVEKELAEGYSQFVRFQENHERLQIEVVLSEEEKQVTDYANHLLGGSTPGSLSSPLLGIMNTLAGVIDSSARERLNRSIYRASRGKAYVTFKDVTDQEAFKDLKSGVSVAKSVFVVYFQGATEGDGPSAMMNKVLRVCQGWNANMYDWPRDRPDAEARLQRITQDKKDKEDALKMYEKFLAGELEQWRAQMNGGNSKIEDYRLFCKQEKSSYHVMNLFEHTGMTMRCNVWYPEIDQEEFEETLLKASQNQKVRAILLPAKFPKGVPPPTYVQVNDFTEPWQDVVDTYGFPDYKTANPGMITSVTFPFLFGMMYGDIGHGFILFCAGLFCCWKGPSLKYSAPIVHYARFMLVQMGFFAVFAGFMYNDLFGIVSLDLFGTRFDWNNEVTMNIGNLTNGNGFDCSLGNISCSGVYNGSANLMSPGTLMPVENFNRFNEAVHNDDMIGPYPFGVDPAWHGTSNELLFVNNLKMKLSVLIGVSQMLLGVGLRFSNALYDSNMVDLLCECVPMLIFMCGFFGYMDFMIIYKWTHAIGGPESTDDFHFEGSNGPPGLINSLIVMGMHGLPDPSPLYPGSDDVGTWLMIATAISVPWILAPKPLILRSADNAKKAAKAKKIAIADAEGAPLSLDDDEDGGHGGHGHGGEFQFGEILIHQIIETIEYVLGTVSHTASYLRVWALSLAHQQLSLVFYSKTLQMAMALPDPVMSGIAMFFAFGAWFGTTVGVLLMMDVLECFLHTLRLHWVEFQSKFYKNTGYKFAPYSVKGAILVDDK